jgi:hypothetical protein
MTRRIAVAAAALALLVGCKTGPEPSPTPTDCTSGSNRCVGDTLERCTTQGKWIVSECMPPRGKCVDQGGGMVECSWSNPDSAAPGK